MKKILFIALAVILSVATEKASAQVKWPFGAANFASITVDNDTLTASASNSLNYFTTSDTLIANTVINVSTSSSAKAGDQIYYRIQNGATVRTVTFRSTYFTSPVITGVANKTKLIHFIYDGSKWVLVSSTQIN